MRRLLGVLLFGLLTLSLVSPALAQGPPEPLTLRSVKGSDLTPDEADDDIETLVHLFTGADKASVASPLFSLFLPGEAGLTGTDCDGATEARQARIDTSTWTLNVCDGSTWVEVKDHAATLAELNAQISSGVVTGAHSTAADITLAGDVSGAGNANVVDDVQTATTNLEAADNDTTQVSSTSFVQQEINGAGGTDLSCSTGQCNVDPAVARLAGPIFTGDPTAPTPSVDDSDTSLATTAFVQSETVAAADISGTIGGGLTIDANAVAAAEIDLTASYAWTGILDASGATRTSPRGVSVTPPATCTVGDSWFDTDETAGERELSCDPANTWTAHGDGGGGGASISDGDSSVTVADAGAGTVTVAVDSSAQGVWDLGGLTIGAADATDQLVLPLSFDAATPTLAFGDRDSGWFEAADDQIYLSLAAQTRWTFTTSALTSSGITSGPALRLEEASATNPLFVTADDIDSGQGRAGANQPNMIAGGVEVTRFNTAASGVTRIEVTPGATGVGPTIAAAGETNLDLNLLPNGTGAINTGLDCSAGDQYHTSGADGRTVCGTDNSGGGATITVKENNSIVDAAVTTLDFADPFDVLSSPAGEANMTIDFTETGLDLTATNDTEALYNSSDTLAGMAQLTHDGTNLTLALAMGDDVQADEVMIEVRNNSGSTIFACGAVYISGFDGVELLPEISVADADGSGTMPAIGVLEADLTTATSGFAVFSGRLSSQDTSTGEGWAAGDDLYVNTSGTSTTDDCADTLTSTRPTGATALVQKVGEVVRVNATLGVVEVFGAGRTNDVPNAITIGTDDQIDTDSVTLDNTWSTAQLAAAVVLDTDNPAAADIEGDYATGLTLVAGVLAWEALANTADTATSFLGSADAETVTWDFQSAFAADRFSIKQTTGDPTAGTLFDLRAADAQVVVFRAGDGTNGITVSQAGALTAEGTGAITATLGDNAASFFGAGELEAVRGGTGGDSSGSTGIAHVASGTWSYSAVIDTDINDNLGEMTCTGAAAGCTLNAGVVVGGTGGNISDGTVDGEDMNATYAGAHLTETAGSPDTIGVDTEVITRTFSFVLETPATGDSGELQHSLNIQGTITRIQCSTDTGTVDINIEERALATPNTAGDDAMSADLQCDSDSAVSTTMQNQPLDATDPLALTISATASTPGWLRVHVTFTVDDV